MVEQADKMTSSTHASTDRPALAIILRVASGVLFAAMSIFVKVLSNDIPIGEIVFFRSAFALFPLVIFLWLRNEFPNALKTNRPVDHLLRSFFGAAAMFASFASIARLPLAEATLLGYLAPVFTALAGFLILKEPPTIWRIGGLVFGSIGVLALVWPEIGHGKVEVVRVTGYALGLVMGILTAMAMIMVRSLSRTESPGSIAFYFVVASMIGGILTVPFGWTMPSAVNLVMLILAGVFGGLAHIAMTLSFRYAEASRLAAFEYLAICWPLMADLLIFRAPISPSFVIALPLVLAGATIAGLERRKKIK